VTVLGSQENNRKENFIIIYGDYLKPHMPNLDRRLLLAANYLWFFLLQDTLRWN
jgi:hypothetical protein